MADPDKTDEQEPVVRAASEPSVELPPAVDAKNVHGAEPAQVTGPTPPPVQTSLVIDSQVNSDRHILDHNDPLHGKYSKLGLDDTPQKLPSALTDTRTPEEIFRSQ